MTKVAIIGAGFSGLLTAVQLVKESQGKQLQICLIDQNPYLGRGLAYGTWDDNFLLNVPAGNMSAFPDDSQHFVRYCQEIDPAFHEGTFVSRRIYGDYLEDLLAKAQTEFGCNFEVICANVHAVAKLGRELFSVQMCSEKTMTVNKVVLALGHFESLNPFRKNDLAIDRKVFLEKKDILTLCQNEEQNPILIVGSGLTAVDLLFQLSSMGIRRKILLISRRGLIPQSHRVNPKIPARNVFDMLSEVPSTVRAFLRAIRIEIARREVSGGNWRDVINEMRPFIPEIWRRLSTNERRRFLTKVLPYWDTHRHRLAPIAHKRFISLIESGQVEVLAARIESIEPLHSGWRIKLKRRGQENTDVTNVIEAIGLFNCTGPNSDIDQIRSPLIQQLVRDNLICADELRIGILTTSKYQTVDDEGREVENLFYIGPMLKATYWESIAVPELRVHAAKLAKEILADL
jgi:uncharacterized NAD(P)/FAD-binding protein YdhS